MEFRQGDLFYVPRLRQVVCIGWIGEGRAFVRRLNSGASSAGWMKKSMRLEEIVDFVTTGDWKFFASSKPLESEDETCRETFVGLRRKVRVRRNTHAEYVPEE